jgi:hypothetical protein
VDWSSCQPSARREARFVPSEQNPAPASLESEREALWISHRRWSYSSPSPRTARFPYDQIGQAGTPLEGNFGGRSLWGRSSAHGARNHVASLDEALRDPHNSGPLTQCESALAKSSTRRPVHRSTHPRKQGTSMIARPIPLEHRLVATRDKLVYLPSGGPWPYTPATSLMRGIRSQSPSARRGVGCSNGLQREGVRRPRRAASAGAVPSAVPPAPSCR